VSASTGSGRAQADRSRRPAAGGRDTRASLEALDELELAVRAQLAALPAARGGELAASGLRTLAGLRRERGELRRALGLLPARPVATPLESEPDLDALRGSLSDLAFAYAEAVAGATGAETVGRLVEHLKASSALLAVVELWIEEEQRRE
jgi:hypothetical protein